MSYKNLPDDLKEKIANDLKSENIMNTIKYRATFGATNLKSYKLLPIRKSRWNYRVITFTKYLHKSIQDLNNSIDDLLLQMSMQYSDELIIPAFNEIVKLYKLIKKNELKLKRAKDERNKLYNNVPSNVFINNANKILNSINNLDLKYNKFISTYKKWLKESDIGGRDSSKRSKGGRGSAKGGKGGRGSVKGGKGGRGSAKGGKGGCGSAIGGKGGRDSAKGGKGGRGNGKGGRSKN